MCFNFVQGRRSDIATCSLALYLFLMPSFREEDSLENKASEANKELFGKFKNVDNVVQELPLSKSSNATNPNQLPYGQASYMLCVLCSCQD